jgi:predicted lipoprotein with Yx(FWY)xxD motif
MARRSMQPTVPTRVSRRLVATAVAFLGVTTLVAGAVALPGSAGAAVTKTTVTSTHNKTWGTILTLSSGMTVYRLTTDSKNKSVCTGTCAKIWPPVVLAKGQTVPAGKGISGLGSIKRADGTTQVTYKGVPLYRFVGDKKAGQATGNVKDTWGQWWVVNPAHPTATPTASTSSGSGSTPTTVAGSGAAY